MRTVLYCILAFKLFLTSSVALADLNWASLTVDNDIFVGTDNGYTNGFFFSLYETEPESSDVPLMVRPLAWSLPNTSYIGTVNSYTLAQTMITPDDITIENPPETGLPYAGMLALNRTFLAINRTYADKLSTTLGVVGPASFAEESQKFVHKIIGSDEPLGWDTQLENELVFQLTRGRLWRSWVSESGKMDFLSTAELAIGTISSSVAGGVLFRYGRGLEKSFPTPLFNSSRISNPAAVDGGWYVYTGLTPTYTFNQIFADGNTFVDSRSVDYDHSQLEFSIGFAYAWENISVTFAINDSNVIVKDSVDDELRDLTRYGALSVAWRR